MWRWQAPALLRLAQLRVQPRVRRRAIEAARRMQAAVQMNHRLAAGTLVQVVDILGHQGQPRHPPRQLGNRPVRRIRRGTQHLLATPLVPAPDQLGVGDERLGRGQLRRIEARPQASQRITKGRNTALGGNAGTAEHQQVTTIAQCFGDHEGHGRLAMKVSLHCLQVGRHVASRILQRRSSHLNCRALPSPAVPSSTCPYP